MSDVAAIKAIVRSRLENRIANYPDPGIAFDHGDYIIEELANGQNGLINVDAFVNPGNQLPEAAEGARYIASATGSGWTKNNIYTRLDSEWHETVFAAGLAIVYVISENQYYGAYTDGWQELTGGSGSQNPIYLNDYVRLSALGRLFRVEIKQENDTWETQMEL